MKQLDGSAEDGARPRRGPRDRRDGVAPGGVGEDRTNPWSVPPDAVLTWNTYTVNAVRASPPTKVQTDGMVYMSYAQAAVYDAVTKLMGRYQPYHDFAFTVVPGASVQAAVAAATQTILDHYLPDQQTTVDAEYSAYIATLSGDVADGVALGQAAASDIIALRTGDGLNNTAVPSYGGNGPILPGQWQLQPGQKVQTPFVATMRPFLLDEPNQFRAPPPPALTSHQYARDLNETEAYGAINSTVRTPDQTAIAYFWVGFNVNQYNTTFQNVDRPAQHGSRRRGAPDRHGQHRHHRRRDRLLRLEVLLPVLAPDHGHPERRQGQQPRHHRRHDMAAAAAGAGTSGVPVAARLLHQRVRRHARGRAAHAASRRRPFPEDRTEAATLTTTQHFDSVRDIDSQVVDARVWLGFHFRNSVEQGEKVGDHVADWELDRFFKRVQS